MSKHHKNLTEQSKLKAHLSIVRSFQVYYTTFIIQLFDDLSWRWIWQYAKYLLWFYSQYNK